MSRRHGLQRQQRQLTTTYAGVTFSGPLPPSHLLEKYNQIVPGAAERLLVMAEKQAGHRRGLETRVIASSLTSRAVGQWMAFTLALLVVGLGGWLLWHDKSVAGLGAIVSALTALVAVFVAVKALGFREAEKRHREWDGKT